MTFCVISLLYFNFCQLFTRTWEERHNVKPVLFCWLYLYTVIIYCCIHINILFPNYNFTCQKIRIILYLSLWCSFLFYLFFNVILTYFRCIWIYLLDDFYTGFVIWRRSKQNVLIAFLFRVSCNISTYVYCQWEYLYNNYFFSISEYKPLTIKGVLCGFKQIYVYTLRQKLRATQYFFF